MTRPPYQHPSLPPLPPTASSHPPYACPSARKHTCPSSSLAASADEDAGAAGPLALSPLINDSTSPSAARFDWQMAGKDTQQRDAMGCLAGKIDTTYGKIDTTSGKIDTTSGKIDTTSARGAGGGVRV